MARQFVSASQQYLSLGSIIKGSPPFTMACWCTKADVAGTDSVFVQHFGSNKYYQLWIKYLSSDPVGWLAQASWKQSRFSSFSINRGLDVTFDWHHLCMLSESSTSHKFYVDGVLAGTNTSSMDPGMTAGSTVIGRSADGFIHYDGSVEWAAIWSVALSADEIDALAHGGSVGTQPIGLPPYMIRPESLVCWPLISGSDPEPDIMSSGNAMTLNNGPARVDGVPLTLLPEDIITV